MRRSDVVAVLLTFVPTFALGGCAGSSGGDRLASVDELMTWVERVHVDSELAQATTRNAVEALRSLVANEYGDRGDAVTSYQSFVDAIDLSEQQSKALEQSVAQMKSAAAPVFDRWAKDLGKFSSDAMRVRSEARHAETRRRYDAIVQSVDPALKGARSFHLGLRDHALFLGHDFNVDAIADIAKDFDVLHGTAIELDRQLRACMSASQAYFETRALPPAAVDRSAELRTAARPPTAGS